MTPAFALLFSAAAAQTFDVPGELVRPEVAAQHVRACGFGNVAIKEDNLLEEEVIVVSGVTAATDEQLRCAATASVSTDYFVQFPEPLNGQYQPLYMAIRRDREQADAKAWLERRGLLARLPQYEKGKTDTLRFAQKIESLCGPKATGALVPKDDFVTFDIGTIDKQKLDDETLWCLINAGSASGLPMGFVGNEYYSKEPEGPSRK